MAKEIHTDDSQEYQFHEAGATTLRFKVKAAHDAHVCLSSADDQEASPIYEIFIGGWNNAKCALRRDRAKPDRAEAETPDVLNDGESRGFWVTWDNEGKVEVGRDGESDGFLSYSDPEPFTITHYGLRTAWGASGEWEIEGDADEEIKAENVEETEETEEKAPEDAEEEDAGEPVWVPTTGTEIPEGAVCGGTDHDCELIVARATHEGALLPGKFVPSHGACYVSWDGGEHKKEEFEVLCGCKPKWVQVNQGDEIPVTALFGGRTVDGETLFIGRVPHEGTVTLGKVHPSHATCYIPYGGEEVGFPEYEVLVRQ